MDSQKPPAKASAKKNKIIIASSILLVALVLIFVIGIRYFHWDNQAVLDVTSVTRYPAVIVNGDVVSYTEWQKQIDTLSLFYATEKNVNPDATLPTEDQVKNHMLNWLIDIALLKQQAAYYNIAVTDEDIAEQTDLLRAEAGSDEAFNDVLLNPYGWTVKQFQTNFLYPLILRNKVTQAITVDDRLNKEAREKAQSVLEQVRVGQKSFEELAMEFSQDGSASTGGDLGFFSRNEMVPEFDQAAFALQKGQVSELVKTQFGFHIIKIDDVLMDDANVVTQVHARHILIRAADTAEYFANLRESANIIHFVSLKPVAEITADQQ